MLRFDYKSPIYWQEDNLVFGLETDSSNALVFRSFNQRTNRSIAIELVNNHFFSLLIFFLL